MIKRKKMNYTGLSDDCVAKEDEFFRNACTKWEEILSKLPSSKTFLPKNYKRLSGGADNVGEIIQNDDEFLAVPEVIESPEDEATPPE